MKSFHLPSRLDWRVVSTGVAVFAAGYLTRSVISFLQQSQLQIIPSPRTTRVQKLSAEEKAKLPYPPDVLPGARDVDSPYGMIRVYEWGPEDGRKVLLVHGISTPSIALGSVAHGLVENGCRVMLFDLFGRGYSDTTKGLPQDTRLFTTQILLALVSSPLSWTGEGSNKFSIVGYSLGGGITAAFASYFPDLVDSLFLIAPAGLIRPNRMSKSNRLMYAEGVIPESLVERIVGRRLKAPLYLPKNSQLSDPKKLNTATAVKSEINVENNVAVPLSTTHPNITAQDAVAYQVDNHEGFVSAFISSIRYGPIQNQHDRWKKIAQRFSEKNALAGGVDVDKRPYKVVVFAGSTDPVIVPEDLKEDANEVLRENMEFILLEAGHEVAFSRAPEIVQHIVHYWSTLS